MAVLSDSIESFIKSMFDDFDNSVELQRNELAKYFSCAPSQINYVLNTRFSIEDGYFIKSKKGGGGYILITKVMPDKYEYLMNILEDIQEETDQKTAFNIFDRLYNYGFISAGQKDLIKSAVSDKAICIPGKVKNKVRSGIIKEVVTKLFEEVEK